MDFDASYIDYYQQDWNRFIKEALGDSPGDNEYRYD